MAVTCAAALVPSAAPAVAARWVEQPASGAHLFVRGKPPADDWSAPSVIATGDAGPGRHDFRRLYIDLVTPGTHCPARPTPLSAKDIDVGARFSASAYVYPTAVAANSRVAGACVYLVAGDTSLASGTTFTVLAVARATVATEAPSGGASAVTPLDLLHFLASLAVVSIGLLWWRRRQGLRLGKALPKATIHSHFARWRVASTARVSSQPGDASRAARILSAELPAYGDDPRGCVLGIEAERPSRLVRFSEGELVRHTMVLGATGAGKTLSLGTLAGEALHRRRAVIVIDLKGDTEFAARLADEAQAAERPFHFWSIESGRSWNPLARGGPSELKDKLIGMEHWTEPHYKRAAERYLQTVFRVLGASSAGPPTLAEVVELLNRNALGAALRSVPEDLAESVDTYLEHLTASEVSAVQGLHNRLAVITESDAGPRLEPGTSNDLDLAQAIDEGALVVFSLNSLRYGELAAHIGSLIIQDLKTVAGDRIERRFQSPCYVLMDEFSALDGDQVVALLERARGAGMGIVLATQELSKLDAVAIGFAHQLISNTAIKIIHRQDHPESAELLAGIAGTVKAWRDTLQTDYSVWRNPINLLLHKGLSGRGTRRLVDEYRIHPNRFKALPTGHAVVMTKARGVRATEVFVVPRPTRKAAARGNTEQRTGAGAPAAQRRRKRRSGRAGEATVAAMLDQLAAQHRLSVEHNVVLWERRSRKGEIDHVILPAGSRPAFLIAIETKAERPAACHLEQMARNAAALSRSGRYRGIPQYRLVVHPNSAEPISFDPGRQVARMGIVELPRYLGELLAGAHVEARLVRGAQ